MTKRKARVGIIEFGGHLVQLDQLFFLFSGTTNVSVAARSKGPMGPEASFRYVGEPSSNIFDASQGVVRSSLQFYIRSIALGREVDWIFISTGPEQAVLPDLVFFALLVVFFRKKIVLNVRGVDQWSVAPTTHHRTRLQTFLRSLMIRALSRFTFESESQELYSDSRQVLAEGSRTAVLPTGISDSFSRLDEWSSHKNSGYASESRPPKCVRVGLLGSLTPDRRNYQEVLIAFEEINRLSDLNLEVVLLGSCGTKEALAVASNFRKWMHSWPPQPYISLETMVRLGATCDVLVAPLRRDKNYGYGHGSGALGDAIMLRKPLLLPELEGAFLEYGGFVFPYRMPHDLAEKILSLVKSKGDFEHVFLNFSVNNVREKLSIDLELGL